MKTVSTFLFVAFLASSVHAQEAPAPRRMPRTPVSREVLAGGRDPMPASREVQGLAAILDGEKLRIDEMDLRLFGVVPPQLAASFGPQARAKLDTLANGQNVSCKIRDRDRDGRLLATCHNFSGNDMALELLKHGLAVTARGSIAGTELVSSYAAAEQAAQGQKIGLWSVSANAPIVPASAAVAPPSAPPVVKAESVALPTPPADVKKEEKPLARVETQTQAKIAADVLLQETQARLDDTISLPSDNVGFFERYQILISGILMLTTALSILGVLCVQKSRDRRDEIKALAAALRGELMAARNVCIGRAKSIVADAEDRLAIWPRLRATLYQAYVGRLGLLGADLARQVASIYGQSSDYAAHYNPSAATGATHDVPKKQALEALAKRIDTVLPKLAEIERTGRVPATSSTTPPRSRAETSAPPITASYASAAASLNPETASPNVEAVAAPPAPVAPPAQAVFRATTAVLAGLRQFIQNHRNTATPTPPPTPIDPQIAEYAAIIEADMARYEYRETVEPIDIAAQKKRG